MSELSKEQIRAEEKFMKGLPRFNVGAFLMPAIWGPAHGFWATILYYPAWLVSDNILYLAFQEPSALHIILAALVVMALLGITIAFAIVSQPIAAHRAQDRGITREQYLKRQRIWAFASAAIAIAMIALATIYNLTIRPNVEG